MVLQDGRFAYFGEQSPSLKGELNSGDTEVAQSLMMGHVAASLANCQSSGVVGKLILCGEKGPNFSITISPSNSTLCVPDGADLSMCDMNVQDAIASGTLLLDRYSSDGLDSTSIMSIPGAHAVR